jgi:MoaA/NifB/PqqE/SkfB family radical SAM enzyme
VTNENQDDLLSSIKKLVVLGLQNISLSTSNTNLEPVVREIRNKCAESGLNLIWNMPVLYSQFNPIHLEVNPEDDFKQGAGTGWLYIEPDGDVLPAQGINHVSGNFLENSWDEIWSKVKQYKSK